MTTTPINTTDPRAAAEIINTRLIVDPCSAEVNSLEWSAHVGDLLDDSDIVEPEDVIGDDGVQTNNDANDDWRTDFWLHLQDIANTFVDPDGFGAIDYADRLLESVRRILKSLDLPFDHAERRASRENAEILLREIDAESAENRETAERPEPSCDDCVFHWGAQEGQTIVLVEPTLCTGEADECRGWMNLRIECEDCDHMNEKWCAVHIRKPWEKA